MKQLHAYLVLLLTVLFLSQEIQSQNMIVRIKGTGDQTVALNNLQKITFLNNNMVLNYVSGDTQSYSFSNLEKLFFTPLTSVANTIVSKADIFLSPADNHLYFRNLPEGTHQITIYRMDGKTVLSAKIGNNESVDMSGYPASIYLIRLNNQVLKFKK